MFVCNIPRTARLQRRRRTEDRHDTLDWRSINNGIFISIFHNAMSPTSLGPTTNNALSLAKLDWPLAELNAIARARQHATFGSNKQHIMCRRLNNNKTGKMQMTVYRVMHFVGETLMDWPYDVAIRIHPPSFSARHAHNKREGKCKLAVHTFFVCMCVCVATRKQNCYESEIQSLPKLCLFVIPCNVINSTSGDRCVVHMCVCF